MRPRNPADYRTLLWAILPAFVVALGYARPDWVLYLLPLSCYFALACGVIAHNHNHCPVFSNRLLNRVLGNWISIFYGYPTFAWIPTHNLNHHKFVNRSGDATITWRFTNRHNLLVAATYFFVSSYYQSFLINDFLRQARQSNRKLYNQIRVQYAVWGGAHAGMLALAMVLHGVVNGLWVWLGMMAIPALFALWTIMLFNFEQHVHTDPWSEHNHSRSFDGKLLNFLLFNNGLHAAHHEQAGLHWSKLPALHARLAPHIHPSLIHRSMWLYFFRQYVLAPFVPSLGSVQIGQAPFDEPAPAAGGATSAAA